MPWHITRREGLVDLFHGMEDMQHKVIRCVGDPMERFQEDALRILRAVRFSAQLGFVIDEKTRQGITALAPNLKNVSAERIQTETGKTSCFSASGLSSELHMRQESQKSFFRNLTPVWKRSRIHRTIAIL